MKHILLLAFIILSGSVHSETFPKGWQLSTKDQYLKEDIEWYKGGIPNRVKADFNGDKIPDTAWILTNTTKTALGLFVSISTKQGSKIIKLNENKITNYIFLGISILKAGKHKTACGKGYWNCNVDETPLINLKNPGINYFKFESANSVYYWSNETSSFKQMWLSD